MYYVEVGWVVGFSFDAKLLLSIAHCTLEYTKADPLLIIVGTV
jgi:hypothetical protein